MGCGGCYVGVVVVIYFFVYCVLMCFCDDCILDGLVVEWVLVFGVCGVGGWFDVVFVLLMEVFV